jgi:hypothetical protein
MKKFFKSLFVIAIVFSATFASGQGRYDKGDKLLNVGFGLGYYYGGGGGVPVIASLEFAVNDVITVGPYFGYTSRAYTGFRYTFLDLGVRGSYHFSELFEIRNEQVDIYGGANLGYAVSNVNYDNPAIDDNDLYPSRIQFGLHAGARYFFSEKVAGFGELGFGLAPLALGVTFKL